MTKKHLSFFFLTLGILVLAGCGETVIPTYAVQLEIWGVFDDSDVYRPAIAEFTKLNPYVKQIQYRKLSPETYKEDLINALASGKGPDIFMIRNSWRASFEDKIVPAPTNLLTERAYRDALVDVAADDFITKDGKIYAIPLSVDSLALYYNKDLFNAAGITTPPATWDEVMADVKKLSSIDQFGTITQSGIALGTGTNINRASDILSVLMMQMGSAIVNKSSYDVDFDDNSRNALDFYTQFARIGSPVYSWNARQHYSIDSFYEGATAMMLNYSWQYDTIKQKNAKLNIGTAPLPQFDLGKPVDIANYWAYAVAKNKSAPEASRDAPAVNPTKYNAVRSFESWQFLRFFAMPHPNKTTTLFNALSGTSKEFSLSHDLAKEYLEATHKPAARRDLIDGQRNDLILAPFASGNLIAKNWYQGNPEAVDGILIEMIDSVVRGEKGMLDALSTASNRINLLNH